MASTTSTTAVAAPGPASPILEESSRHTSFFLGQRAADGNQPVVVPGVASPTGPPTSEHSPPSAVGAQGSGTTGDIGPSTFDMTMGATATFPMPARAGSSNFGPSAPEGGAVGAAAAPRAGDAISGVGGADDDEVGVDGGRDNSREIRPVIVSRIAVEGPRRRVDTQSSSANIGGDMELQAAILRSLQDEHETRRAQQQQQQQQHQPLSSQNRSAQLQAPLSYHQQMYMQQQQQQQQQHAAQQQQMMLHHHQQQQHAAMLAAAANGYAVPDGNGGFYMSPSRMQQHGGHAGTRSHLDDGEGSSSGAGGAGGGGDSDGTAHSSTDARARRQFYEQHAAQWAAAMHHHPHPGYAMGPDGRATHLQYYDSSNAARYYQNHHHQLAMGYNALGPDGAPLDAATAAGQQHAYGYAMMMAQHQQQQQQHGMYGWNAYPVTSTEMAPAPQADGGMMMMGGMTSPLVDGEHALARRVLTHHTRATINADGDVAADDDDDDEAAGDGDGAEPPADITNTALVAAGVGGEGAGVATLPLAPIIDAAATNSAHNGTTRATQGQGLDIHHHVTPIRHVEGDTIDGPDAMPSVAAPRAALANPFAHAGGPSHSVTEQQQQQQSQQQQQQHAVGGLALPSVAGGATSGASQGGNANGSIAGASNSLITPIMAAVAAGAAANLQPPPPRSTNMESRQSAGGSVPTFGGQAHYFPMHMLMPPSQLLGAANDGATAPAGAASAAAVGGSRSGAPQQAGSSSANPATRGGSSSHGRGGGGSGVGLPVGTTTGAGGGGSTMGASTSIAVQIPTTTAAPGAAASGAYSLPRPFPMPLPMPQLTAGAAGGVMHGPYGTGFYPYHTTGSTGVGVGGPGGAQHLQQLQQYYAGMLGPLPMGAAAAAPAGAAGFAGGPTPTRPAMPSGGMGGGGQQQHFAEHMAYGVPGVVGGGRGGPGGMMGFPAAGAGGGVAPTPPVPVPMIFNQLPIVSPIGFDGTDVLESFASRLATCSVDDRAPTPVPAGSVPISTAMARLATYFDLASRRAPAAASTAAGVGSGAAAASSRQGNTSKLSLYIPPPPETLVPEEDTVEQLLERCLTAVRSSGMGALRVRLPSERRMETSLILRLVHVWPVVASFLTPADLENFGCASTQHLRLIRNWEACWATVSEVQFPKFYRETRVTARPDPLPLSASWRQALQRRWQLDHTWFNRLPNVRALTVPRGAHTVVLNGDTIIYSTGTQYEITALNLRTGARPLGINGMPGHSQSVTTMSFVAGAPHLLITGSVDQTIRLFDLNARRQMAEMRGHTDRVWAVDTYDGVAFSGGSDRTVRRWSLDTYEQMTTLEEQHTSVSSLRVMRHQACPYLACGSSGSSIRIWDVGTGAARTVTRFRGHHKGVYSLQEGSRVLLSGSLDNVINGWDPRKEFGRAFDLTERDARGNPIVMQANGANRDSDNVGVITLACDDTKVVSGCSDNLIKVWDLRKLQMVTALAGHNHWVTAIQMDGDKIISASRDKTIRFWNMSGQMELHESIGTRA